MDRVSITRGMPALVALAALAGVGLLAPAPAQDHVRPGAAAVPTAIDQAKLPPGYLARDALPDSLALLPPPPAAGSAAMARDEEARTAAGKLRGTPRFAQATTDAALDRIPQDFSCALGVTIGKEETPKLYALMGRMLVDVGLSTYAAKNKYERVRPFVVHKEATCYPKDEPLLRQDGSYPSGHSAVGWGLALVLAELAPDRADALLQRGRDFGQSRVVCEAHWQSDVDAGRVIAAATVARLHGDEAFRADLDAARAELAEALEAAPAEPGEACAAEARALATPF